MTHEVEKVLCKGCGVQLPDSEVNAAGLCADCVRLVDAWGKDEAQLMGLAENGFMDAPLGATLDAVNGLGLEPATVASVRQLGEADEAAARAAWEAGAPARAEVRARRLARERARAAARRESLTQAQSMLHVQLRDALRMRQPWAYIRAMRQVMADREGGYRGGVRALDIARIRALVETLRLVRAKLEPWAYPDE